MSLGRVLGTTVTAAAVAGCAILAIGMSRADSSTPAAHDENAAAMTSAAPAQTPERTPVVVDVPTTTSPASRAAATQPATTAPATTPARTAPASPPQPPPAAAHRAAPTRAATDHSRRAPAAPPAPPATTHSTTARPAPKPPAAKRGSALPLRFGTGSATKVITVVAHSTSSTTATLQAWTKAPGGGWLKHGSAVTAHVGSAGLSSSPSEFRSATPIGSFTLTQAFGRNADPGTSLPYFRTTPADWWISQSGPLYNTHQRCSSGCSFTRGSPNEHLYYETPYYNYAVVINTPSGASAYPHGSAFFLHVHPAGTGATAGCVAIPQSRLVPLMRWLTPSAHPRILIGIG